MSPEFIQGNVELKNGSLFLTKSDPRECKNHTTILFLHGWPQNWSSFRPVMQHLMTQYHVAAIDLPGIGESRFHGLSGSKREVAGILRDLIEKENWEKVVLVGHDVGGQIVYSFLKNYEPVLHAAVILNVAIPGVDPWSRIKQNPYIWHFPFHNIPDLPEGLVEGRERIYFDYFYNAISAAPESIEEEARREYADAYRSRDSLKAGFDWYRAFPGDEADNLQSQKSRVDLPLLYIRGEKEMGNIDDYLKGFRESGVPNVRGVVIKNCGHFSPDEKPVEIANTIDGFLATLL